MLTAVVLDVGMFTPQNEHELVLVAPKQRHDSAPEEHHGLLLYTAKAP